MAKEAPVPVSAAEKMEYKRDELAKALFDRRKELLKSVGERPYDSTPASKDAIRSRLAGMRNDPAAWGEILAKVGKPQDDGSVLYPKKLIEEVQKYERELRKGFTVGSI